MSRLPSQPEHSLWGWGAESALESPASASLGKGREGKLRAPPSFPNTRQGNTAEMIRDLELPVLFMIKLNYSPDKMERMSFSENIHTDFT